MTPYREAPLSLPRTRWGLTWRRPSEPWVSLANACTGNLVVNAIWFRAWYIGAFAVALFVASRVRPARVPVKIPGDDPHDQWVHYVTMACHETAGCHCERCGHGRLACERCDECGRSEALP